MTDEVKCPVCGGTANYEFSGRDLMFDLHKRYDYHKCGSCQLVFQFPMPTNEEIPGFYPEDYCVYAEDKSVRKLGGLRRALLAVHKGYNHLESSLALRALAWILGASSVKHTPMFEEGGRLLDVGCGNGRYLLTMQRLGWEVEGVEFSESGVSVCRKNGIKVHHGDLSSARFPDHSFELITVRHVIEHIPTPQSFFQELVRVLKPGGRLVIETPNSCALGRPWFSSNWYANDVPRHLMLFSTRNLSLLAQKNNLGVESCQLETTPKIVLNSMDYAFGSHKTPRKKQALPRFFARLYVRQAEKQGQGDTILMTFRKPL